MSSGMRSAYVSAVGLFPNQHKIYKQFGKSDPASAKRVLQSLVKSTKKYRKMEKPLNKEMAKAQHHRMQTEATLNMLKQTESFK